MLLLFNRVHAAVGLGLGVDGQTAAASPGVMPFLPIAAGRVLCPVLSTCSVTSAVVDAVAVGGECATRCALQTPWFWVLVLGRLSGVPCSEPAFPSPAAERSIKGDRLRWGASSRALAVSARRTGGVFQRALAPAAVLLSALVVGTGCRGTRTIATINNPFN